MKSPIAALRRDVPDAALSTRAADVRGGPVLRRRLGRALGYLWRLGTAATENTMGKHTFVLVGGLEH